MLKYLAKARFNYIDNAFNGAALAFFLNNDWGWGIALVLIGAILSTLAERLTGVK